MADLIRSAHTMSPVPIWDRFSPSLLRVAYQPIVALATGGILAHEALARPFSATGEPIRPDVLFGWAEHGLQADVLDAFVLERILRDAAGRLDADGLLFVNLRPGSVSTVMELLLQQTWVSSLRVVLELVEQASEGTDLALSLGPLREAGYRVAIDDVGAGYSSLARLIVTRPDFAKIDLSLVRDIDRDPVKFSLVEAIVRFAKRAGIFLIAEGVETAAELHTLQELGTEYAQGYFLGKPLWSVLRTPVAPLSQTRPRPTLGADIMLGGIVRLLRYASRGMGRGEGAVESLTVLATEATGADFCGLVHHDDNGWQWRGGSQRRQGRLADKEEARVADMLVTGEPVVIQSARDEGYPTWHNQSLAAFPIGSGRHGYGALVVGFAKPHQIRPLVVEIGRGLAALFQLTLVGGPTLASESWSVEALLGAAEGLVSQGEDPTTLLQQLLRAALTVTGSHDGFVALVEAGQLSAVGADGETFADALAPYLDEGSVEGQGPTGIALRTRTLCIVDDVRVDPRLLPWREDLLKCGVLSAAAVPLVEDDHLLGLLKIYHPDPGAFSHPDRSAALRGLTALGSSLLTRMEEYHRREEELRRRTLLLRGHSSLAQESSPEAAARLLVDTVQELTEARVVALLTPDPDGRFTPVLTTGPGRSYYDAWEGTLSDLSAPDAQTVLAAAYRLGQTCWATGTASSAQIHPLTIQSRHEEFGIRWILAVPLWSFGVSLGVLLVHGGTHNLDARVIRMVEDLARSASTALFLSDQHRNLSTATRGLQLLADLLAVNAPPPAPGDDPLPLFHRVLDSVQQSAPDVQATVVRIRDGKVQGPDLPLHALLDPWLGSVLPPGSGPAKDWGTHDIAGPLPADSLLGLGTPIRSAGYFPFERAGEHYVLVIASERREFFTPTVMNLYRSIARCLA